MEWFENICLWSTVFLYVASFCLSLFSVMRQGKTPGRTPLWLLYAGLLVHTATIALRWISGGHIPVTNIYELNLIGAWFTVLLYLLFVWLHKIPRVVGLILVPIAFLALGYGATIRTPPPAMGGMASPGPAGRGWPWERGRTPADPFDFSDANSHGYPTRCASREAMPPGRHDSSRNRRGVMRYYLLYGAPCRPVGRIGGVL